MTSMPAMPKLIPTGLQRRKPKAYRSYTWLTCATCNQVRYINNTGLDEAQQTAAFTAATTGPKGWLDLTYNTGLCTSCRKRGFATGVAADILLQHWLEDNRAVKGPHGANRSEGNNWPIDCPEYYIPTTLGQLRVLPASSLSSTYFQTYCRFDEPARAAERIKDLTPHCGKWNFMGNKKPRGGIDGGEPGVGGWRNLELAIMFAGYVSRQIREIAPDLKPFEGLMGWNGEA